MIKFTSLQALLAAGLALLLATGFIVGHVLPVSWMNAPTSWLSVAQSSGHAGWLTFLLLQTAVAVTGIVPASLAALAAGAIFGLLPGFALAVCSTIAGSVIAFALSRSMLRSWVAERLARRPGLERLSLAMAQDGWRSVCLLRLSPLMPFAATSYALGLTPVRWSDYLVGTLASMPALFCYVALGRFGGSGFNLLKGGASVVQIMLLGVGAAATLAFMLRIRERARHGLAPKLRK